MGLSRHSEGPIRSQKYHAVRSALTAFQRGLAGSQLVLRGLIVISSSTTQKALGSYQRALFGSWRIRGSYLGHGFQRAYQARSVSFQTLRAECPSRILEALRALYHYLGIYYNKLSGSQRALAGSHNALSGYHGLQQAAGSWILFNAFIGSYYLPRFYMNL